MVRPPDPLYIASGRLSHAVRAGAPEAEVHVLRRELAGEQLRRFVSRMIDTGITPTTEQTESICAMLKAAVAELALA